MKDDIYKPFKKDLIQKQTRWLQIRLMDLEEQKSILSQPISPPQFMGCINFVKAPSKLSDTFLLQV